MEAPLLLGENRQLQNVNTPRGISEKGLLPSSYILLKIINIFNLTVF